MPDETNSRPIAQALDCRQNDELRALGYLQQLNFAAYDVKGQRPTGFGALFAAKIDFGLPAASGKKLPFAKLSVFSHPIAHGVSTERKATA